MDCTAFTAQRYAFAASHGYGRCYNTPFVRQAISVEARTSPHMNINPGDSIRRSDIIIEEINLDDERQLQLMSEFCIRMFFGSKREDETFISRGWRNIKLAAMQKAQMLDFAMPTDGNRAIFVAKNSTSDIIGCCEVIEEKVDLSYKEGSVSAANERDRKKNARLKPIIENLSVQKEYRRKGIGADLVIACENVVQTRWIPRHDEILAQVEEENTSALNFFAQHGYESLFIDPTCKKVSLDGTLLAKETTVSKVMVRKFLDGDMQYF